MKLLYYILIITSFTGLYASRVTIYNKQLASHQSLSGEENIKYKERNTIYVAINNQQEMKKIEPGKEESFDLGMFTAPRKITWKEPESGALYTNVSITIPGMGSSGTVQQEFTSARPEKQWHIDLEDAYGVLSLVPIKIYGNGQYEIGWYNFGDIFGQHPQFPEEKQQAEEYNPES